MIELKTLPDVAANAVRHWHFRAILTAKNINHHVDGRSELMLFGR